jgi:hypothetical protein
VAAVTPAEIPDEVVAAALQADHEEGVRDGRSYHQVAEHQVRRLIAGAVTAERERIIRLADRNEAVCTGDEGTSCYFSALIREVPADE